VSICDDGSTTPRVWVSQIFDVIRIEALVPLNIGVGATVLGEQPCKSFGAAMYADQSLPLM
jgi:hypothetical protein